ncbi:MAG: dodecin domain-containing protein [Gemmatimonadota bacterium]
MAEPFQTRPPDAEGEGLLARVTGRRSRAATVRGLESLFADAARVRDVASEHVTAVGERHGIDLAAHLRTARRQLYRRFLEHCLDDFILSELEVEDLLHLRRVLHLSDADVDHVQNRVTRDVYGSAVETVLEDNLVDDEEKAFLKRLSEDLDVPEFHASTIFEQGVRRAQQRTLKGAAIESAFLRSDGESLELEGSSRVGLSEAIQDVVDHAVESMPDLAWADLSHVRVRVSDGRIVQWCVRLSAAAEDGGTEN